MASGREIVYISLFAVFFLAALKVGDLAVGKWFMNDIPLLGLYSGAILARSSCGCRRMHTQRSAR